MRRNVKSFKRLAQLQGVLINLCERNDYLYDFVAPTRWQNYCRARGRSSKEIEKNIMCATGERKASKVFSIEMVKELYGIETENDNLADAVLIGHYVVNNVKLEGKTDAQDGTEIDV